VGRPRQKSCSFGHPFTEANVRRGRDGRQVCVVCARRRARDWQRRHRATVPRVDDKQGPPTIALVVWRPREYWASWTFHQTRAEAAAHAPTDAPYSIVDVARKPWIQRSPPIGRGVAMRPTELARLQAAVAANTKPMARHPRGLAGRCQDALDDLELVTADPNATPQAKDTARRFAAAMVAALRAENQPPA
jgi:hypothetical protein